MKVSFATQGMSAKSSHTSTEPSTNHQTSNRTGHMLPTATDVHAVVVHSEAPVLGQQPIGQQQPPLNQRISCWDYECTPWVISISLAAIIMTGGLLGLALKVTDIGFAKAVGL